MEPKNYGTTTGGGETAGVVLLEVVEQQAAVLLQTVLLHQLFRTAQILVVIGSTLYQIIVVLSERPKKSGMQEIAQIIICILVMVMLYPQKHTHEMFIGFEGFFDSNFIPPPIPT